MRIQLRDYIDFTKLIKEDIIINNAETLYNHEVHIQDQRKNQYPIQGL